MPSLPDLPYEVIMMIVEYLQLDSNWTQLRFYEIGIAYQKAFEQNQPRRTKDLHSLLLTSSRLYKFLKPMLYQNLFVRDYNRHGEKAPLKQLKWSLENRLGLSELVNSAIIPCGTSGNNRSIFEIYTAFWLPNLSTLTIFEFKDWKPMVFDDNSHVGTSPVQCLRLIECGAHEEALAAVLSWPDSLKVLQYDADQFEWEGHYEGEQVNGWTCEAFVRMIRSQKESLEELIMTRPPLDHEGLGNGSRIDLSEFTALKTLRIYHVFLCGWDDPEGVSRCLPPNLEVLEVFYDDTDLTQFFWEDDEQPYDTFILDVIRNKTLRLPRLHTVKIYSPEWLGDRELEETGQTGSSEWSLPGPLAAEAKEAGINMRVWIGQDVWFRIDGLDDVDLFRSLELSQSGLPNQPAPGSTAEASHSPPGNASRADAREQRRFFGSYAELQL